MTSDTPPAAPDLILKFEGELSPEQLTRFRALWEIAAAGHDGIVLAYDRGRAEEREACAQLAEGYALAIRHNNDAADAVRAAMRKVADRIRARKDTP